MSNTNKYGQPVGFALPDWQPVAFPGNCRINGQHCNLEPLEISHSEALFEAFSQVKMTGTGRGWVQKCPQICKK